VRSQDQQVVRRATLLVQEFRRLVEAVGFGLLDQQLAIDELLQDGDARLLGIYPCQIGSARQLTVEVSSSDLFVVDDRNRLAGFDREGDIVQALRRVAEAEGDMPVALRTA
jgi:hypothetical protein